MGWEVRRGGEERGGAVPRPPMIRTAGLSSSGEDVDGVGWSEAVSAMVAGWAGDKCRC